MSTFIKYDTIPFEDFFSVYHIYAQQNYNAVLLDISKLREFLFFAHKVYKTEDKEYIYPIKIFYITEFDYIRNEYNHYFLFQSSSKIQDELEKLAKRIKIELKLKNIDSLFRIDPKYGLIFGTAKAAIDPAIKQDKTNCFITLYLTSDSHHPEISLFDYVEKSNKKRYVEIFEKHNHCSPGTIKILGIDLAKIKKAFTKSSPTVLLYYENIIELGNSLIHKHKLEHISISLIYEEVSENEVELCLLDKKKAGYFPAGLCKFFISVDELLQN